VTQPADPGRPLSQRSLVAAGIVALVALATWFILHSYISPASRECLALYRAARTAADTARVDGTTPHQRAEAKSCGFIRSKARW
jgi:hypothetical protein